MAPLRTLDRLSALIESAVAVVGETDLDRVLRRLVSEAMTATGARYAALGVLGEHGVLSDFLYEGISEEQAIRIGRLPSGHGLLGTVIRRNETILVDTIGDHPDSYGFPEHHPPMTNFLGVPVSIGDATFGNLYLTEKEDGFTQEDVLLVEALSRIAGAAIHTARLQDRFRRLAVVEDRERIARDLHDSVIQDIFAVGLGLQGLTGRVDDADSIGLLTDVIDRLDGVVERLRGYIFELRKPARLDQRLDDQLQELVSRMGSAYPTRVTLEMNLPDEENPPLGKEILMIVTETLSNALRHAAAASVDVSVSIDSAAYVVRVADDGVGFDPDTVERGMGLTNLRRRSEELDGNVSIDSNPNGGTVVEVTLPRG